MSRSLLLIIIAALGFIYIWKNCTKIREGLYPCKSNDWTGGSSQCCPVRDGKYSDLREGAASQLGQAIANWCENPTFIPDSKTHDVQLAFGCDAQGQAVGGPPYTKGIPCPNDDVPFQCDKSAWEKNDCAAKFDQQAQGGITNFSPLNTNYQNFWSTRNTTAGCTYIPETIPRQLAIGQDSNYCEALIAEGLSTTGSIGEAHCTKSNPWTTSNAAGGGGIVGDLARSDYNQSLAAHLIKQGFGPVCSYGATTYGRDNTLKTGNCPSPQTCGQGTHLKSDTATYDGNPDNFQGSCCAAGRDGDDECRDKADGTVCKIDGLDTCPDGSTDCPVSVRTCKNGYCCSKNVCQSCVSVPYDSCCAARSPSAYATWPNAPDLPEYPLPPSAYKQLCGYAQPAGTQVHFPLTDDGTASFVNYDLQQSLDYCTAQDTQGLNDGVCYGLVGDGETPRPGIWYQKGDSEKCCIDNPLPGTWSSWSPDCPPCNAAGSIGQTRTCSVAGECTGPSSRTTTCPTCPTCVNITCEGKTHKSSSSTTCPVSGCQQSDCCVDNPTCTKSVVCGKGRVLQTNYQSIICKGAQCSDTDCCKSKPQPTCAQHACPINSTKKTNWEDCTGGTCTDEECCTQDPKPTCASGYFTCPTDYENVSTFNTAPCKSYSCKQSECCKPTPIPCKWGPWSDCIATDPRGCGLGYQTRTNTPPQNGGTPCSEIDGGKSKQECDTGKKCHGKWGPWVPACPACGPGTQTRTCSPTDEECEPDADGTSGTRPCPKNPCPTCTPDYSCAAGTHVINPLPTTPCVATGCTPKDCCASNPQCSSLKECPEGRKFKNNYDSIVCKGAQCTDVECCIPIPQPTCQDFTCPTHHSLKPNAEDFKCSGTSCTDPDCCTADPKPTCFEDSVSCPSGYQERSNIESTQCAEYTCTIAECCAAIPPKPTKRKTDIDNRRWIDKSQRINKHDWEDNRRQNITQNGGRSFTSAAEIESPAAGSVFYPGSTFIVFDEKKKKKVKNNTPYDSWGEPVQYTEMRTNNMFSAHSDIYPPQNLKETNYSDFISQGSGLKPFNNDIYVKS